MRIPHKRLGSPKGSEGNGKNGKGEKDTKRDERDEDPKDGDAVFHFAHCNKDASCHCLEEWKGLFNNTFGKVCT